MSIDNYTVFLNEVYFDEVSIQEMDNILFAIGQNLKAHGLAFMKYNSYIDKLRTLMFIFEKKRPNIEKKIANRIDSLY